MSVCVCVCVCYKVCLCIHWLYKYNISSSSTRLILYPHTLFIIGTGLSMTSDDTDEDGGISVFSDPGSSLAFFLLDKDPFNNHTQVVNTLYNIFAGHL